MPESSTQQVVEVRAALSHALGVATEARDAARAGYEAARERRGKVVAAARERRARIAEQRDKRLEQIDTERDQALADLAGAAVETALLAAPGAAGAPWPGWHATPAKSGTPAPELRTG